MTQQEILNQNWTKTAKAKALYSLGFTRRQVAELLCNGNYGFAHNIWKKWNEEQTSVIATNPASFNFDFNRTFGVEIEVYGATRENIIEKANQLGLSIVSEGYNHTTRNHWKIVSDGSINGANGCEIVSPVLSGSEGLEQLRKVCRALNRAGAKVNSSCGLHIHFGVNDFTLDNFKNLVLSYLANEKKIDAFMPNSRRRSNNRFCQSLGAVSNIKSRLRNAESISNIVNMFPSRCFKLNVQSFNRHGTIEFRQHSGSTQFSKIKNWILICARMVEFAKSNGMFNNLNSVLNETLQNYIEDRAEDLVA